jgi:hypothetical protein
LLGLGVSELTFKAEYVGVKYVFTSAVGAALVSFPYDDEPGDGKREAESKIITFP